MTWWFVGLAFGQDPVLGTNVTANPGPELDQVSHAVDTNGRLYGAVSHLERRVFPLYDAADGGALFHIGGSFGETFDAVRLPATCDALPFELKSGDACMAHVDMFSASGGLAFGNEHLAVFYSVGFTGVYAIGDQVLFMRTLAPFAVGGVAALQLYTAPFQTGPLEIGQGIDDVFGLSRLDYTLGARGGYGGVSIHAAFYASDERTGLYTNLSEERVRALLSAVVRDQAGGVPYLLLGVVDSPILEDALDAVGVRPSLFARKLELVEPDFVVPAGTAQPIEPDRPSLWTGHAGSTSRLVDGRLAIAWRPQVMVHEAAVTVHTRDYPGSVAQILDEDFDPDENVGGAVSAGMMRTPAMPWLGVLSRTVPFVEVRGGAFGAGLFELVVGFNSPEILAQFPYATRALFFRVEAHSLRGES